MTPGSRLTHPSLSVFATNRRPWCLLCLILIGGGKWCRTGFLWEFGECCLPALSVSHTPPILEIPIFLLPKVYLAGSDGCGRANCKGWKVLLPLELPRADILALGGWTTPSICHLFAHYLDVFAVPPVSYCRILLSARTIRFTRRKGLCWPIGRLKPLSRVETRTG